MIEKEEDMVDSRKPVPQGKSPVVDKQKQLQSVIDRMAFLQRKHGMEMPTIKGMTRAYLFAMELKDLGFKAEDLK